MSHHAPSPNGHGEHADHSHGHGHHDGMPTWWKITIFLVVITMAAYGLASGKMTTSFHYLAGSHAAFKDIVGNFWNVFIGYPAIGLFIWWLKKPAH